MQRPDLDRLAEHVIAGAERQVIADMPADDVPYRVVGRILGAELEPLVQEASIQGLRAFPAKPSLMLKLSATVGSGRTIRRREFRKGECAKRPDQG
jgi:hypothetical protein